MVKTKTRAMVLTEINAPLELWELTVPQLQSGQVLVRLAYSGFCHSQLNEIRGRKGEDKYLPHTLGHEGSGVIESIGEDVTKVVPGDHVVVSWIKGFGKEGFGCRYEAANSFVNSGPISTFLTYAVISENRVIPIPKEMPLREAALLGCAVPTGAGVVKNEMNIQAGESFAVFGAGGLGLSALIAAKHAKAFPIIAVDVFDGKLEVAKEFGATHVVNAKNGDPVQAIQEITRGNGVDYVFESAGIGIAMEQAFSSLKAPGGLCVLAGNLPKGERISIDPFELIRGKKILGTWGGKSQIDKDVATYVSLFLKGELDFSRLITHEVNLDGINELIKEVEEGKVGRGLVHCASE